MYHHNIIGRDDCEIIKNVNLKQRERSSNGEWIPLLKEDLDFIEKDIYDEMIKKKYSKTHFLIVGHKKAEKTAFSNYLNLKENLKKKLKYLHYEKLQIQRSQLTFKQN